VGAFTLHPEKIIKLAAVLREEGEMNLSDLSAPQLLALHAKVADELRRRGVTRSANNPTGDLAEYLFCKAFRLEQAGRSHPNIDAIGPDRIRYQIKGRRITPQNRSRQLGAIRDMDSAHFDLLAGVLFNEDYSIARAALIPHAVALERASFVKRTNSHCFHLRDEIWNAPGVRDVTRKLRAVKF
jgi:hypothetical protein